MPAAFIPICAYQGKFLGSTRPGVNFTICDLFQPKLVENNLCYSLNPQKIKKWKTKPNHENGLLLVIDPGVSLSEENNRQMAGSLDKTQSDSDFFGGVFIHTLSHFHDARAGTYILQSLKKMIGTTQFLGLPNNQKECQIETFEECVGKRFLDNVQNECGCIPWAMSSGGKVGESFHGLTLKLFFIFTSMHFLSIFHPLEIRACNVLCIYLNEIKT